MRRSRQTGSKTQKSARKPRKKNALHEMGLTWIHFAVIIASPPIMLYLAHQYWVPLPWTIGPVTWLATIVAVSSFLRSLITRRGLTVGSSAGCMALAAFVVAGVVYMIAPPSGPLLTLLLTQLSATIIFIILAFLLRRIQVGMDPLHHVEVRPLILNQKLLGQWLQSAIPVLVLWDGLTLMFYNTPCSGARCAVGEALFGIHRPFSNIYLAAYFGMMAFTAPILAMFQVLWRILKRQDSKPPQ